MAFEFCCFVSYPHGQDNVLVPFVNDFVDGLRLEIGAVMRKKLAGRDFPDGVLPNGAWSDEFLKGGDRFNEMIGSSICKSACMIVFYTPLYFDDEHVYCAREFRAMELLEQERLKYLQEKGRGLIITIILRGADSFPKVLEGERKYYRFDDIDLNNPADKIRVRYADKIREMAAYIYDRCQSLDEVAPDLKHDCNEFCLPSEEDARAYVETVLKTKIKLVADPYPGGRQLATAKAEGAGQ